MRGESVNSQNYDPRKIALMEKVNEDMEGFRARERVADVVRDEFQDEPLAYVTEKGKVVVDESLVDEVGRRTAERYEKHYAREMSEATEFDEKDREFIRRELAEDIPAEQIRRFSGEHFIISGKREEDDSEVPEDNSLSKIGFAGLAAAAVLPMAAADEPADSGPQMDHQGMSELQGQVEDVKSNMYDFPGSYTRMDLGENRELDLDVQREEPKFQDIEENLYKFPGKYTRMDLGQHRVMKPDTRDRGIPKAWLNDGEVIKGRITAPDPCRDIERNGINSSLISKIEKFVEGLKDPAELDGDRQDALEEKRPLYRFPGHYTRMDMGEENIDLRPERCKIPNSWLNDDTVIRGRITAGR